MPPKMRWAFGILLMIALQAPLAAKADVGGFTPTEACGLLNRIGLPTQGWKTYFDNESGCSSRSVYLSSGNTFRNFMTYYVEGKGRTVKRLKLIVSVLNPDEAELAHAEFQKVANFLIMKTTSRPAPESVSRSIESGIGLVSKIGNVFVEISRQGWVMNTDSESRRCYEIQMVIR